MAIISNKKLAFYIDHTLLKKEATKEDIEKLCKEAIEHGFKTVCLYPKHIPIAKKLLKGKKTVPIAVVDFPKGRGPIFKKVKETKDAIKKGAMEIDMVIDYMALKNKDYKKVFDGIKAVVLAAKPKIVKVILEISELSDYEKIIACALAKAAGAKFVKTSTGFSKSGATIKDVKLMKEVVGKDVFVKASGGIRTKKDAIDMIEAGSSRIGASSSVQIVSNTKSNY
jgi:deoxyribose-phosphate aldolase